jgi:hypothetical protein
LDRINQWIVNCDNKSLILVTLIGIFVGVLFATDYIMNLIKIYLFIWHNPNLINLLYLILSLSSILLILGGIWFVIQSIIARTKPYSEEGLIKDSLIYYGTISKNSFEVYSKKINNLDEESLKNEIISQIYINSKICTFKFENYNKGLIFSILGFSLFAILMGIGHVLSKTMWGI